jgi:predicted P-loop ATPase
MGATDSSLNRAIGRKTLVAAVRRVFQPGCKFDYVPVLEGIQGSGKSTALRTLAGEDDLFSDQEVVHLDAKAQQEAVRGKFIYEIAELGGLNKTDVERTKAFLSRTHDRARPAYGYASIDQPRRCVFIATTNERGYLRDPTGNRRYWPVVTGVIHIDALKRDRDQLWAEAVVAHQNGEMLYLPPDLAVLISVEQDDRREEDPWISQLERVIAVVTGDEERMGSAKLLEYLGLPVKDQSRAHARRLKDCMNQLGWKGPEQLRVAGRSVKGYSREIAPQTAVE